MNILLLEDDEISRMGLAALLKDSGNLIEYSQGHLLLKEQSHQDIDIAFVDLDLEEDLLGFEVVNRLSKQGVYCVILTGHEDDEKVTQGYEVGAKDYLVKPIDEQMVEAILHRFKIEQKLLLGDSETDFSFIKRSVVEKLRAYSFSKQPILITGETGTGKTVMAENIYNFFADLKDKGSSEFAYVTMNCSEFSESLIESELFGHVKGAFTGAQNDKIGRIEQANGGVLFIDEIGSIPEFAQRKLLKVLDEKKLYKVGSNKQVDVDFILITATCENLEEHVQNGTLREDFYHRISGLEVELPPFRNLTIIQKEDLIRTVLSNFKRKIIMTDEARLVIFEQYWPGNIREVKRFLEKCNTLALGVIDANTVKSFVQAHPLVAKREQIAGKENFSSLISKVEELGLPRVVSELESYMINHFYKLNDEKSRKTINQLKISNNLFYKYIKQND